MREYSDTRAMLHSTIDTNGVFEGTVPQAIISIELYDETMQCEDTLIDVDKVLAILSIYIRRTAAHSYRYDHQFDRIQRDPGLWPRQQKAFYALLKHSFKSINNQYTRSLAASFLKQDALLLYGCVFM